MVKLVWIIFKYQILNKSNLTYSDDVTNSQETYQKKSLNKAVLSGKIPLQTRRPNTLIITGWVWGFKPRSQLKEAGKQRTAFYCCDGGV